MPRPSRERWHAVRAATRADGHKRHVSQPQSTAEGHVLPSTPPSFSPLVCLSMLQLLCLAATQLATNAYIALQFKRQWKPDRTTPADQRELANDQGDTSTQNATPSGGWSRGARATAEDAQEVLEVLRSTGHARRLAGISLSAARRAPWAGCCTLRPRWRQRARRSWPCCLRV